MSKMRPSARTLGIAALVMIYAVLVHYVNATGRAPTLGAALAIMPVLAIGLTMLLNSKSRIAGLILLVAAVIASWLGWPLIRDYSSFIFWLQDMSLTLILFITFGRTLMRGRKPLCVNFAEMVHGSLSAAHERYARQVTVAWVVFFGLMALVSTVLFFFAPLATWSFFVNFLSFPLIVLMFIAEYRFRLRRLSGIAHGHILDSVHAYMNKSARVH